MHLKKKKKKFISDAFLNTLNFDINNVNTNEINDNNENVNDILFI